MLRKIKLYIRYDSDADAKPVTSDGTGRGLAHVADNRILNINKADWAALDALPGVDAATAKKIIAKAALQERCGISARSSPATCCARSHR